MKIALVQLESITGDIEGNVTRHLAALRRLRATDVDLAVFPELSLTNYEPRIAARTALADDDARLASFAQAARELDAPICVGAAIESAGKPSISAILCSPGQPRRIIHKAYLHADEEPLFAAGIARASVLPLAQRIALAICFDISVDAHIEDAASQGMDVYLASVAKTVRGIKAARKRLCALARQYRVPVLAVNSVGRCEGSRAGGGSLVIDRHGSVVEALDDRQQAILIYDTDLAETRQLSLAIAPSDEPRGFGRPSKPPA